MRVEELASHYYLPFAAAFVRGTDPVPSAGKSGVGKSDAGKSDAQTSDAAAVLDALARGVSLKRFKRSGPLPRVAKVLGFLRGVAPSTLIDLGPGRGAFLWPLLDAFPALTVHGIDALAHRVAMIEAVARGGVPRLSAEEGDICRVWGEEKSVEVVTALEVIEHLTAPERAIERALKVATRFVVASVPSKPDENPEHVNYFAPGELEEKFLSAGASRVATDHVHNHRIVWATP